jgi:drug/metabolite transporter (DMT)-like permease
MRSGTLLVLFSAMLWATDAPFRLHLTKELASTFIVLGEHFIDVLFVLPILAYAWPELKKLSIKQWGAVLFVAICGSALGSVAFTQAFHYVNPSVALLLQKLQPLIAISLAAVFLKEKLTPRFWSLAALALFGAYLISFPDFVPQVYPGEQFNPNTIGVLLALVAALFWGASTVLGRYMLASIDFKLMTALRFSLAFLFLIPLTWAQGAFPEAGQFTGTDMLFIAIVAFVSGVVSLFIYYKGLSTTPASVATLAELGYPLAAVFINWIFIPGSALVPMQLVGTAILLGAVYLLGRTANPETRLS